MLNWPIEFAVKKIASFLSSYLDGVSEQNLQVTLSGAVGKAEIQHVRIQPGLLAEQHLKLLSSDVSVYVTIPWTKLGSEPTVIIVRDVWVEACTEPLPSGLSSGAEADEALERWRLRKAREVEAALAAAITSDAGDTGQRRSFFTRQVFKAGHAALRQLQVRVVRLHFRLHSENSSGSSLELRCDTLALDEGATNLRKVMEVPPDVTRHPAKLDKIFELSSLSASLRPGLDGSSSSCRGKAGSATQGLREELEACQTELGKLARARGGGGGAVAVEERKQQLEDAKSRLQNSLGSESASSQKVVGPLSLGARLWHSSAAGLLWLKLELKIDQSSAAVILTPEVVRYARSTFDWYLSVLAAPPIVQQRSEELSDKVFEDAETIAEYVDLRTRRTRGDALSDDHEARLLEIEDLGSVQFLVRCRQQEAPPTPAISVNNSGSRGRGLLGRMFGWRNTEADAKEAIGEASKFDGDWTGGSIAGNTLTWPNGTKTAIAINAPNQLTASIDGGVTAVINDDGKLYWDGGDVWEKEQDLDEEAGMDGILPEVEEPNVVQVSVVIPLCDIVRCRLDSGATEARALRAVGGVRINCEGTIEKSAGSEAVPWLLRGWDADVSAELLSLQVLLDSEPLMLLQQQLPPSIEVEGDGEASNAGSDCSFKSAEENEADDNEESTAVNLELKCKHKGGGRFKAISMAELEDGVGSEVAAVQAALPRWSVQVRLRQEPFRFMLGPLSLRSALDIVISVLQSGQQPSICSRAGNVSSEGSLQDTTASVTNLPNATDNTGELNEGENSVALDLDLDVAAPVISWGLVPEGQLILSLGRLLFRTSSVAPPPTEAITRASECTWNTFACQCQLTATSLTVHAEEVYKPTTICVRAWRDVAGSSSWQFGVDTDIVQWTVTPTVLRAAGQMPLSLDYALTPLRGMLAEALNDSSASENAAPLDSRESSHSSIAKNDCSSAERPTVYRKGNDEEAAEIDAAPSSSLVGRVTAQTKDLEAKEEAPQVKVHICIRSCTFSLTPSDVHGVAVTALLFHGIEAEYSARRHCVDTHGKVESYSLQHEGTSVGKCAEGGSFQVRNSDRHIALDGRSSMIEFAWRVRPMRGVLTTLDRACGCLTAGRDTAKEKLLVGESAGMSAQLWSRYVNERIQAQLQQQAKVRAAELLPGLFEAEKNANQSADLSVSIPESHPSDSIPEVNGDCSVDVSLNCKGVTVVFPDDVGMHVKSMQVVVTDAECAVKGFPSGDATAEVSLGTIDIELRDRCLLKPRRAGKLLEVKLVRCVLPQPVVHWIASWAQVCILYRQRDYDALRSFLQENVTHVISSLQNTPSNKSGAASESKRIDEDSSALPRRQSSQGSLGNVGKAPASYFRLHFGAPRVFLPTDKALLRSPGSRKNSGLGGGGGELLIDPKTGEPGFEPDRGEGLMVFDFGNVTATRASGNETDDGIDLQLRGAHVLGITEYGASLQDILCPASVSAILKTGGPLEFHMKSIVIANEDSICEVEDTSKMLASTPRRIDHRMSFTRAQLTLLFDVVAENITYTGRLSQIQTLQQHASGSSGDWVRYVVEAATVPGRGFKFSWSWPGELVLDIAFTPEVPLVRFSMTGGLFSIETNRESSMYLLRCRNLSAVDRRIASRNCNRTLLICTEQKDGEAGFEVRSTSVVDKDAETIVRLGQPVLQILPQLIMDVLTFGLSSWQQSTYSRYSNQSPSEEELKRKTPTSNDDGKLPAHKIEVNFHNAAFQVMSRWSEPAEYFEFAGSLFLSLSIDAECIRTDRADLKGGCFRLTSLLRNEPSTLIPCLEWTVQAKQTRHDDNERKHRHSTITLKPVVIRPYAFRISAQDHDAMVDAFMELLSFDADPAEPRAEIEGRDPLALEVESRFTINASLELQGVEVQVLDEEGGHAWPGMKAHASTKSFDAVVELRPGIPPTINLFTPQFEIDVCAHNHRLGSWEPVLPSCRWYLSHHRQRQPDRGPREVIVHSVVKATDPVALLVSPSTVRLAKRIFSARASDVRYGHLLAGLNLSGNSFRISSEHSDECSLEATASMTPLDWLLKGSMRRDGKPAKPWLSLSILDKPRAKSMMLELSRETSLKWNTGAVGILVCRLLMLRPPQRILIVGTTVCICNRTTTDLEVRFLKPDNENEPILLARLSHSVDARCVDSDQSAVIDIQGACISCGSDGGLKLGPGQMMYAPAEAQRDTGDVVMQVRPALEATGGIAYEWSSSFQTLPLNCQNQATLCSTPPPEFGIDLPPHWLHLRSCGQANDCGRDVDISAPLTIFNSCPCEIYYWLNPVSTRTCLGVERDSVVPYCDLIVENGRGGHTRLQASKMSLDGAWSMGSISGSKLSWKNSGTVSDMTFIGDRTFIVSLNRETFTVMLKDDDALHWSNGDIWKREACLVFAEVFPVVLDDHGYFYYRCGDRNKERAKPRWSNVNCIQVAYDAKNGLVDWTYFQVKIQQYPANETPPRLNPQAALPLFGLVAEELHISFALKEHNGAATSWSLPIHAQTSDTHAIEETLAIAHQGMRVRLCTYRVRRQLVVYTRCWFVNSTGLDVRIQQPGGPGRLHPIPFFADRITFVPELTDKNTGDTIIYVAYKSGEPVVACIPDVGGDEPVMLTSIRPCCLRTEKVTLVQPEQAYGRHHVFRDLSSRLVTLLPQVLLFNRTDCSIGFRQVFSRDDRAVWLDPGKSGTFWWHSDSDGFRLQVAARKLLKRGDTQSSGDVIYGARSEWSPPFQLGENTIGSYPVALESGASAHLLCINIDQEGCTFSVAIHSSDSCHMLVNQHPELVLRSSLEGAGTDRRFFFGAAYGETVAVAGKEPFAGKRQIHLNFETVSKPDEKVAVNVDLNRAQIYNVPLAENQGATRSTGSPPGISTLRVPAHVDVQLRNRVAYVTIRPASSSNDNNSTKLDTTLELNHLRVALLTEGAAESYADADDSKRREAFTVSLSGVRVEISQLPSRRRDVNFRIVNAQVTLQHPRSEVVLTNVTQPFLETRSVRDDVTMLDVHMRSADLVFGELELNLTDGAIAQAQLLARNLARDSEGLNFDQISSRLGVPYHDLRSDPPPASSKLVLGNLKMGTLALNVWCRIHLPDAHYIPKALRDTIQMVSLGNTILDVKGAQVKFPQQIIFNRAPAEGSPNSVLIKVWEHYLPYVKASWKSLLTHSNLIFGGSFRNILGNNNARRSEPSSPLCVVGRNGELTVLPMDKVVPTNTTSSRPLSRSQHGISRSLVSGRNVQPARW